MMIRSLLFVALLTGTAPGMCLADSRSSVSSETVPFDADGCVKASVAEGTAVDSWSLLCLRQTESGAELFLGDFRSGSRVTYHIDLASRTRFGDSILFYGHFDSFLGSRRFPERISVIVRSVRGPGRQLVGRVEVNGHDLAFGTGRIFTQERFALDENESPNFPTDLLR